MSRFQGSRRSTCASNSGGKSNNPRGFLCSTIGVGPQLAVSFEVAGLGRVRCEQRHELTLRCNPCTLGVEGHTKDRSILTHSIYQNYYYNPFKLLHERFKTENQIF